MDTTQVIVTIIGSNALFSFAQYMISRADKKKEWQSEETKALRNMILGLGHDKLLYLTDKYAERGGIAPKERRNLKYLYDPYIKLGGNGDCEIGYKLCEELPTLSNEEAAACDRENKRKEYGIKKDESEDKL